MIEPLWNTSGVEIPSSAIEFQAAQQQATPGSRSGGGDLGEGSQDAFLACTG
jgi:hypothetical protein